MLKWTKRFSGSYKAELSNGEYFSIETMGQYTTEVGQDEEGNKWVLTYSDDWQGDLTYKCKTKKECQQWAEHTLANNFYK